MSLISQQKSYALHNRV